MLHVFLSDSLINLPNFKWLRKLSPGGVPLLRVHFPDGQPDDDVIFSQTDPIIATQVQETKNDNCIYGGYFAHESTVFVTMTGGCAPSKTFEVKN